MRKLITQTLAAIVLSGATAFGGTFTADFATQDTSTFQYNGSGTLADGSGWMPFITTNRLILTLNQNNLSGSFSPNDFDNGAAIQGFTAKFQLQFGPGTSPPADGAAFSFGPFVNQSSVTYNEVGAGATASASAFSISFHTYTSNGGPAVDAYLFGQQIGHVPLAVGAMVNSLMQDVVIQLNPNSTLNVTYGGQVIYTNLYLPNWGPTNGFHIISARTGGLNEVTDIGSVSIVTTLYSAPVAPTVTTAPQSVSVAEGASASFSVGVDGTGPFAFQWTTNGTDIPNETNQTLTLSPVLFAENNAKIAVRITNPASSITSSPATLMVIQDTTPPTVVKAAADLTFTSISVTYSKSVSDSALATSNYSIDQGATVSTITRVSPQTVNLTTSQLTQGQTYTLTINGVQDIDTMPNTIAANTKVQVRSFVFLAKTALHKKYDNVSDANGFPVANLFGDSRYPNQPDRQDIETAFEYPAGGAGRIAADPSRDYFDSIEGYFMPPTTTNYVFFTCGADRWSLYLSTDDTPANKKAVATVGGWTNPRGWNTGQGGTDMTPARSDTFGGTEWPDGGTITLTNGQRYYMLLVHHDPSWSGADDFAATYTFEGEPVPTAGDPPKLTGSLVGFFFDPTGASVTFSQQPQSTNAAQGTAATFTANATGSSVYGTNVLYQWQSAPKSSTNWADISGATGNSYSTPLLGLADDGTQFRVVAILAPITVTSAVATVAIVKDTTPVVAWAGAMTDSVAGTVDVGIGFNKTLDTTSASVLANYSVSSGSIASLTIYTNRVTDNSKNPLVMTVKHTVLLKVTGLSGSGTVTVKNVADMAGNIITTTNIPFTVDATMKWGVVGANELGGVNGVVPVTTNGFDLYSDGIAEWGSYDEATFVYEQVTGDFDKKLRVEYQDGSSEWARAGLIVRDVTNFGVDRNTQTTNAMAGRYQKCFVSPVGATLTGPGTAGAQDWELNRRLVTGGATTGATVTGVNAIPQYPNGWCRIQRVGQTFTLFRSNDGVNWVQLGQTTASDWGAATPMPDTLFVGPEFSPENGNITQAADQGTFLAQFRDYGNFSATVGPPTLTFQRTPTGFTLTYTGTLQSANVATGPWSPVAGATSPFTIIPNSPAKFYRAGP